MFQVYLICFAAQWNTRIESLQVAGLHLLISGPTSDSATEPASGDSVLAGIICTSPTLSLFRRGERHYRPQHQLESQNMTLPLFVDSVRMQPTSPPLYYSCNSITYSSTTAIPGGYLNQNDNPVTSFSPDGSVKKWSAIRHDLLQA